MGDDRLFDSTAEVTVSRDMSAQLGIALGQQPQLFVLSGAPLGRRVVLGEKPVLIGRGTGCQLLLETDSVSRQHARVEKRATGYVLVDLGSTNGSFVNEVRIVEHELRDGDQIKIGKAHLKYVAGGNIEGHYHEEFERLTQRDALTGAFNKQAFEEKLKLAIMSSASHPRPLSLIVFDLDHFKELNDSYGHEAGDAVLRQMAESVRRAVDPQTGVFGRIGGEEFAVLTEQGAEPAYRLAAAIRAAVESCQFEFETVRIRATVSIGVAARDSEGTETDKELYTRADGQLYAAKRAGRNCVR